MKKQASVTIPNRYGNFELIAYSDDFGERMPHLVYVAEHTDFSKTMNVRIHSECLTGDLFGSFRCDCGEQLDQSMKYISENGGMILYLRQEGRGIGLINKLKAYNLQDDGVNTKDANIQLGFQADARTFDIAIEILNDLGVKTINLLTNNPLKIEAIEQSNIKLNQRIPLEIEAKTENKFYLETKRDLMGHIIS